MIRKLTTQGYTLLELTIVLAMVGILCAVATPSFTELIRGSRLTSTANELNSVFKFARGEAAKREKSISLVSTGNRWSVKLGNEVLRVFEPKHDSIYITNGLTDILISQTGRISANSSFHITDSYSTKDYCLRIYISGQSQMSKEDTCA